MGWFDDNAPAQQDWFTTNAPSVDTDLPGVTVAEAEETGFLAKINALLGGKEGVPESPSRLGIEAGEAAPEGTPFVHGAGSAIEHMIPRSWEDVEAMLKPPMPSRFESEELPASEELGAAWRGERGAEAQGEALMGTLLQGLPLAHLPFAKSPLRPRLTDLDLVERIRQAQVEAQTPPPIPPEYAERRFTLQEPPPPEIAPAPPIEDVLANVPQEPPLFNPELGPMTRPEFPMPLRTETMQLSPAERNGQILERRKGILARKAELTARAANGEQGLEGHLAAVEADLNDPVTNPVVHAPPVEVPVRSGEFAKPGYTAVKPASEAPVAEPKITIPPEDVRYAGGEPPVLEVQPEPVAPPVQTEVPQSRGISEARTEAELGPGSVEPGAGAEMGAGLEYGRQYLNKGLDPRLPIRRAETSGMVGARDVGVVHAELERLRGERSRAAEALETNPADPVLQDNFARADDAQRAWRKELQPVLTKASDALREAHATSMPAADVSTYQGLADLFDEHFKGQRNLTPEMRTAMAKAARGVKETRNIANGEMVKVEETLTKQMRGRKVMTPEELDISLKNELETIFKDCVLG